MGRLHRLHRRFLDRAPRQLYLRLRAAVQRQGSLPAFDDQHPCVWVLSTGRTGTQTLAEICRLAEAVASFHEPTAKLFDLGHQAYGLDTEAGAADPLIEAVGERRERLLASALGLGLAYVETSPQVTFLAPQLLALHPGSRFIHLVRRPHAVVRSAMRRGWFAGHEADGTRITPREDSNLASRWTELTPEQKNYWLWAETNRWILAFLDRLPVGRRLQMRSQALFEGDADTLSALFGFLAADLPPLRRVRKVLGQRLNAQQDGAYQPPADLEASLGEPLYRFVAEVSAKVGYRRPPGQTGKGL